MRQLRQFDAVIAEVEDELLPNWLCSYLFELSQMFNRFYDQVPVLMSDGPAWPSATPAPTPSSLGLGCWQGRLKVISSRARCHASQCEHSPDVVAQFLLARVN